MVKVNKRLAHMHPDIAVLVGELNKLRAGAIATIASIQKRCAHDRVAENSDGTIRICCRCGFEEHFRHCHETFRTAQSYATFAAAAGQVPKLQPDNVMKNAGDWFQYRIEV